MQKYEKSEALQELMMSVIHKYPEFEELEGARITCLQNDKFKKSNGKPVYADCAKITDKVKAVAGCDFIITFYADGLILDMEVQERLMYHELMHVGYEPTTRSCFIVPHDLEDFKAVIDRWGTDWIYMTEEGEEENEEETEGGEQDESDKM